MTTPKLETRLHRLPWRDEWQGKRLKEVVRAAIPGLGSRPAMLVITNGLVRIDNGDVLDDADTVVAEGSTLIVDLRHGVHGEGKPRQAHLHERMKVYHDDDQVVVVSKRAWTLVQPLSEEDERPDQEETPPLVELLKHYWRAQKKPVVNPMLVQRLDEQTSGLMVLAKTPEAARVLQEQLKPPRALRREYLALVEGVFASDAGHWHTWMGFGKNKLRQSLGEFREGQRGPQGAQDAETRYEVAERLRGATLLRLRLETGRTHQIRIHCAEAGHPVLGDRLYRFLGEDIFRRLAADKVPTFGDRHPSHEAQRLYKEGQKELAKPPREPKRFLLHSCRLVFRHPTRNETLAFDDPLPQDFADTLQSLR